MYQFKFVQMNRELVRCDISDTTSNGFIDRFMNKKILILREREREDKMSEREKQSG